MSRKVALPDGGWALLRDAKQVPEKYRRPILRALPQLASMADDETPQVTVEGLDGIFDMRDATIVAFVQEWSFDLPVTADSVMELPVDVVDALDAETAPLVAAMINPAKPGDPQSPPPASPSSATG